MTGLTLDDIKLIMKSKENMPLIYVSGYEDKDYKFMRKLVEDINPDVGEDMYSTTQELRKIITTLRYMEAYDYEKMIQKIRGYC